VHFSYWLRAEQAAFKVISNLGDQLKCLLGDRKGFSHQLGVFFMVECVLPDFFLIDASLAQYLDHLIKESLFFEQIEHTSKRKAFFIAV
jgi:hypothetical protein